MTGDSELTAALNTMLTCAPHECSRESACLLVAKQMRDWLALYQPHVLPPQPEPDPGEVTDYAPSWEWPGC